MGRSRAGRHRPHRLLAALSVAAAGAAVSLGSADGGAGVVESTSDVADRVLAHHQPPLQGSRLRRRVSGRLEPGGYRGFSAYLIDDVPNDGEHCTPSPLWTKEIAGSYELGCEEIQVSACSRKDMQQESCGCVQPLSPHFIRVEASFRAGIGEWAITCPSVRFNCQNLYPAAGPSISVYVQARRRIVRPSRAQRLSRPSSQLRSSFTFSWWPFA